MARPLETGDAFPEYVVNTVDGKTMTIPQDLDGEYSAIIFYRGSW